MRFVFITGGVVSSIGKGIAAASIGTLLQSRGFTVRIRKMDPYLNIDPGTMSPYEHGEVFVTEDGAETDLDIGHYERFTGVNCSTADSISSGQIFSSVIQKERVGKYLGSTVQIIPHVTDEIKCRITKDLHDEDFVICEIGGTVGDIEANPFLEAIRQFANDKGRDKVIFLHVTLLPYLPSAKEIKTKPTQHSIKELQRSGISPNIILCRSSIPFSKNTTKKLALFGNVSEKDVIPALDVDNLSKVVVNYKNEGLDERILSYFNQFTSNSIKPKVKNTKPIDFSFWENLLNKEQQIEQNEYGKNLNIYIVAKYLENKDAYLSLQSALYHASVANCVNPNIHWIDAEKLEQNDIDLKSVFKNATGILIPGGYGQRGVEGKIKAIQYARENNIATLGLCLGSQLMVIETLRNVAKLDDVNSSEFGNFKHNAVSLLTEWKKTGKKENREKSSDLGGSMRLGKYKCKILPNTLAFSIYKSAEISERHRHRYEINITYKDSLKENSLNISGLSATDDTIPEIVEHAKNKFFIGVQFHPEFKSRFFKPHPLFVSFIKNQIGNEN